MVQKSFEEQEPPKNQRTETSHLFWGVPIKSLAIQVRNKIPQNGKYEIAYARGLKQIVTSHMIVLCNNPFEPSGYGYA